MTENKPVKGIFKYIIGGLSGMGATLFVQPLDLIKTRMQISGIGGTKKEYKNTIDALKKIVNNEGIVGIYKGLDAALLRQATYTTARLGVYSQLNDLHRQIYERKQYLVESMGIGLVSGGCGAFVGNPSEVALIRLTADGRLPVAERRNYKSVGDALIRIVHNEGFFAMWNGCVPTISRAMVVNMAQMATYTQIKNELLQMPYFEEGIILHFFASTLAGFVTTVTSMPVDMAKTRIQNQLPDPLGNLPYRGTIHVLATVIHDEGLLALWKGFTPYFARLGPHTVLTFMFMEQLTAAYNELASK